MPEANKTRTHTQNAAHLLEILSWLVFFIVGVMIISVLAVDYLATGAENPDSSFWPIMGACFAFGLTLLAIAHYLKKHLQWARYLTAVISIIILVAFPVGTFMGLFILGYLQKGWHDA